MVANEQSVSIDRIFLDLKNPRHEPYSSEADVIDYLCREEYVHALAKDIATLGLNPLDLFALLPVNESKRRGSGTGYVVAEGNRRLCAIKLLRDPELAPANLRKEFRRLAETAKPIAEVRAVIFKDAKKVAAWLERIHGGVQNGVGRKPWNAEQKTRHTGDPKNVFAQAVLDYAETCGLISTEQRKGKLTNTQRYLGNALVREALGLEGANSTDLSRSRPAEDVDLLLTKFVGDLLAGKVHSRANARVIQEYSRSLSSVGGISGTRIATEPLRPPTASKKRRSSAKEPPKPKTLNFEPEIEGELKRIDSYKLQKLYFSICALQLDRHALLISIGVWSFFETLTAKCRRDPGISFPSFLSKSKLGTMGFTDRDLAKVMIQAIDRLRILAM